MTVQTKLIIIIGGQPGTLFQLNDKKESKRWFHVSKALNLSSKFSLRALRDVYRSDIGLTCWKMIEKIMTNFSEKWKNFGRWIKSWVFCYKVSLSRVGPTDLAICGSSSAPSHYLTMPEHLVIILTDLPQCSTLTHPS